MPHGETGAFWGVLLDILVLVSAGLLLGGLAERVRQSAILGYLLAGMLLGPHAFDLLPNQTALAPIAELGVALLLFTIGLEFSLSRLRRFGGRVFVSGVLQIVLTIALGAAAARMFGWSWPLALTMGAMISLSSTAAVLRLLYGRSELDSVHGRNALGMLLIQDLALVPLVFLVTLLGKDTLNDLDWADPASLHNWGAIRTVGTAAAGIAAFFLVIRFVIPRLFRTREMARNRDLAILLATVCVTAASLGSHRVGLSPALGAFVAGMILGDSPFATQIRGDVGPFRALFVTLFFSSVGTQADPGWAFENLSLMGLVVALVLLGKTVITGAALAAVGQPAGASLATGVCIAQIGEFSFVLGRAAMDAGTIDSSVFKLVVTATTATLFLTPFLIALAPRLSLWMTRAGADGRPRVEPAHTGPAALSGHIVLVGFGPAGQRVARDLLDSGYSMVLIEQNADFLSVARSLGIPTVIGDARSAEVLDHVHVEDAAAVVLTVPDPATARQVVERIQARNRDLPVVARARYHAHRWQLRLAGARHVVDEEEEVGRRIAEEVLEQLESLEPGHS